MLRIRNCERSDRDFLVQLLAQDSDPIPPFSGITPGDVARGTEKVFGFPVWWVLTTTRWLKVPVARLLVAEHDGTPAGFVSVAFRQRHAVIGSLITDRSHRRRGIGSALMEAAEAAARAHGDRTAVLEVSQDNEAARGLYRRRGYRLLFVNHWFEGSLFGPPAGPSGRPPAVRPATRGDLRRVRSLRRTSLPPSLLDVVPPSNEDPANLDRLARSKRGEHQAWCIGPPDTPSGLVRGYTSDQGGLSYLTCPYLDSSTPEAEQNVLANVALDWLRSKGATRTVSALPSYSTQAIALLPRVGLVERLRSEFMCLDLD